jgi:glucose/arabinose dehydrogenase
MTDNRIRAHGRLSIATAVLLVAACGSTAPTATPASPVATASSPPASATAATSPSPAATPTPTPAGARFDPSRIDLRATVLVEGLRDPVDVAAPGDGSGRLFVVEQAGNIRLVEDGALVTRPFLDIRKLISSGGERGLLGLAFHPDFPDDPRLFVNYTDLDGNTVVAEYRVDSGDPDIADAASERILLQFDQPFANHNGGAVVFGDDGMLYIATGDGGSGGDPQGNGRRLDTFLAKVLRIDVDTPPADPDTTYTIPPDNPFLDVADAMPEIWLTGLRNPWRMRFDGTTGDLWIGDVGQGAWEEIDVAPAGVGGLDFGWNVMEGTHCYSPASGCDQRGLTLPVAEYGHNLGCAVIGGVVIRGPDQPLLDGGYLFSDSCSGNLWLLDTAESGFRDPSLVRGTGRSISSIALDEDGTVLATDLGTGELVRIDAVAR